MNYNQSYTPQWRSDSDCRVPKSYKSLGEALRIVRQSIQGEKEDELFYDYLISVAPTSEEKDIITGIRDDERKHGQMFRGIYEAFTRENIPPPKDIAFERPKSYIDGIRKAFFGELNAMERYRIIMAGLPYRYYRDMVFEILTDEMEHADKYNYILNLNVEKPPIGGMTLENSAPKAITKFTPQEAAQIASALGIDFNKVKFDLNQFTMGVNTELEHGRKYNPTNVTGDDPITTGKIALAHLREFPDYYTRLAKLEQEAKAYFSTRNSNMY
jgi:rubrerythrin